MKESRRGFIPRLGALLAGVAVWRCASIGNEAGPEESMITCYRVASSDAASPGLSHPLWSTLRSCWLELEDPRLRSFEDTAYSRELRQRHAETLEALEAAGEVEAAVAVPIGAVFEQAIAHIQRSQATCYIVLPSELIPRQDLMQQAALLEEMAGRAEIDPDTVAQAQAALERDIAWLAPFHAGETPPSWQEMEIDPAVAEAARLLVLLLLAGEK